MDKNITNGTVLHPYCIQYPQMINSEGLARHFAGKTDGSDWLDYSTPRTLLLISTMLVMSHSFHFVLKRIGLPIIISQIMTGLILSRLFLQTLQLTHEVITLDNVRILGTLGSFGYAFFMFQSGVKMDLGVVNRVGRKAWYIGILVIVMPWVSAILITLAVRDKNREGDSKSLFLVPMYSMTAFPVVSGLLTDLKILNSELGRLAQSSAMVADILNFSTIIFFALLRRANRHPVVALVQLGIIICYILLMVFVLRPAMFLMVRMTKEGKEVSQTGFEYRVLGVYILGLAVPHGPPLGSALVNKFDCLVSGFFLPLFVITCAMRVEEFGVHFTTRLIFQNTMIAFMTTLIKFGSCFMPMLYWNMHKHDAAVFSLIMSAKGVVELGFYTFGFDLKFINADIFNFMLVVLLVLASIVPILVKKLHDPSRKYAGYQIRKLMDCKFETDLQILACIHLPNNISSMINLLSISCRKEAPIAVTVLHLIKLIGQASPIFFSHQKKKNKSLSSYCYSENVILSFKKFEGSNWGNASVDTFTAMSPPDFMHDDICTLALDKLASLIILPFHRTWYIDGSLESEDRTIRNLNRRILKKSPSSVGILIDHGNLRRPLTHPSSSSSSSDSCNVAMLFVGGNDDREALTFAKRIAKNNKVNLTVAHLIAASDGGEVDWETILDSEVLRDVKNSEYIKYEKHIVSDGSETVKIVLSMVNVYNLIIVGRRYQMESPQTSCLQDWCEFPELGILGDFLASKDVGGKCSALIIQQQQRV
ncbi:Cation/H(+) antiporter like [Melia azedarach]|uniref:Cation/H(+) antiporter like n=1 Tax=Melia azedarach TaxID=155640 RepID=A0ACC1Y2W1_MELAZ|nr:Cation/H(+) antiporter like [Melia azedarach]